MSGSESHLYHLSPDDVRPALIGALLLLCDVAGSPVLDMSASTVAVRIDRATWESLQTFRTAGGWRGAAWPALVVERFREDLT